MSYTNILHPYTILLSHSLLYLIYLISKFKYFFFIRLGTHDRSMSLQFYLFPLIFPIFFNNDFDGTKLFGYLSLCIQLFSMQFLLLSNSFPTLVNIFQFYFSYLIWALLSLDSPFLYYYSSHSNFR